MKFLPLDLGIIHFVGIGGIGMSGIAEVMHNLGYRVQGSDISSNANVSRLQSLGININLGHCADNVGGAAVVVVSSAVRADNSEILAARSAKVPVVQRAEMLAELMRLKWSIAVGGTHGKTTTTSMIAALLDGANLDPTVINGGIINAYGTNAILGDGDWMVVEADESDGSFVRLPAMISVVTNIDAEHLDYYGDFDSLRGAFQTFAESIPFYGFMTLCSDHQEVRTLIGRVTDRRIVTYGLEPPAEVFGYDLAPTANGVRLGIQMSGRSRGAGRVIAGVELSMPGAHNVRNALAAVAIAVELGVDDDTIRRSLAGFKGVKRRFTLVGESQGVAVVDDYAHHPVEIAAVLLTARERCRGRIIAVIQPHRYSRLCSLFKEFCTCFDDADVVIVADVFPAGESPIEGIDRDALVSGIRSAGGQEVYSLGDPGDLAQMVAEFTTMGDMVVCLGAGNVTRWANQLPAALDDLALQTNAVGRRG